MTTFNDVVRNPRIPKENAGSHPNRQNKRRVYNKSAPKSRQAQTNNKSNKPQQSPFNFNLFIGNSNTEGNGLPQILADRALLGIMNAQNIPNGLQNPANPVQNPVPPVAQGHILGGGVNNENRQQLADVVAQQVELRNNHQNLLNEIQNNQFNVNRQEQLQNLINRNAVNQAAHLDTIASKIDRRIRHIQQDNVDILNTGMVNRNLLSEIRNQNASVTPVQNDHGSKAQLDKALTELKTMFRTALLPERNKNKLKEFNLQNKGKIVEDVNTLKKLVEDQRYTEESRTNALLNLSDDEVDSEDIQAGTPGAPRARAPIMASTKPPMIFSRRKPPPRRAGDETSDTDARAAQDELMADSSIYVDKRVLFVEDSDDAPDAENTAPRFTDKTPNRDTNQDTDIGASDDLIVQGQGKIVSDWENMSF